MPQDIPPTTNPASINNPASIINEIITNRITNSGNGEGNGEGNGYITIINLSNIDLDSIINSNNIITNNLNTITSEQLMYMAMVAIHRDTQDSNIPPQTVSISTAPIQTENSNTNSSTDLNSDDNNSQDTCSICFESLSSLGDHDEEESNETTIATLNRCEHQYHNTCLMLMGSTGRSLNCPQCRDPFTLAHPHLVLD